MASGPCRRNRVTLSLSAKDAAGGPKVAPSAPITEDHRMTDDRLSKLMTLPEHEPDDPFWLYGIAQEHAARGDDEVALGWYERPPPPRTSRTDTSTTTTPGRWSVSDDEAAEAIRRDSGRQTHPAMPTPGGAGCARTSSVDRGFDRAPVVIPHRPTRRETDRARVELTDGRCFEIEQSPGPQRPAARTRRPASTADACFWNIDVKIRTKCSTCSADATISPRSCGVV